MTDIYRRTSRGYKKIQLMKRYGSLYMLIGLSQLKINEVGFRFVADSRGGALGGAVATSTYIRPLHSMRGLKAYL